MKKRKREECMKEIRELCERIDMPEEMTAGILEFHNQFDFELIKEYLLQLCHPSTWNNALSEIKKILGEDEKGIKILSCMLRVALHTYEDYVTKGISDEIYVATMKSFTRFVQEHKVSYGTYGFDREGWTMRQASGVLFRLGELEYEFVSKGEQKVVSLHIPSDADLTGEKLEQSYKIAKEFFESYFPDYGNAPLICQSWLLSPTIKEMLPKHSRILKFQEAFDISTTGKEEKGFAEWLFKNPKLDIWDYPENTSLQRKMKQHLLNGGTVAEAKGILREPAFTE